jgi:hypothetical protein
MLRDAELRLSEAVAEYAITLAEVELSVDVRDGARSFEDTFLLVGVEK